MKIVDLYPLRGFFQLGAKAEFELELEVHQPANVIIEIEISNLDKNIYSDRQTYALGAFPDRIPVGVIQVRLVEILWLTGKQHRLVPKLCAALNLCDGLRYVPEWQGGHGDEPLGRNVRPFREEVVVGPHALEP